MESMEKLSMCRICLIKDIKTYSLISAELQELYERLTKMPFETKDKKPVQVCYICCARLQNCHRLQAACLKSEEFFNRVIADSELNEIELQDLNTLKIAHPFILISCVPSTRKDPEDDKIDEDNDFKFDPLEIASDVQVKHKLFEDDSFTNEEVHIKSEVTVEEEDICAKYGVMSDNRHTMQNTELEHDIQLKTVKIVLERIDLEESKADDSFTNDEVHIKSEGTVEEEDISTEDSVMSDNRDTMQNTELEHDIHLKTDKIVLERKDLEESKAGGKPKNLSNGNTDTGENPYMCNICGKSFNWRSQFVRHIRIHSERRERPHRCNICEKSFLEKSYLAIHTRIHTGEKPHSCNICMKSFIQKNQLVSHKCIHPDKRPYRCNICEKRFSHKPYLVRHTRNIHSGAISYKCNVCEQSFTIRSMLQKHSRIHTDERSHTCNVCGKKFAGQERLMIHTYKHTGERPYKCNVCERSFPDMRGLRTHGRIHSVKQHKCNICEKRFINKSTLTSHSFVHTSKKPYGCNVCERSFLREDSLIIHKFRNHSA